MGFTIWGLPFDVILGYRVWDSRFRSVFVSVSVSIYRVWDSRFRVWVLVFRLRILVFRHVQGRISGGCAGKVGRPFGSTLSSWCVCVWGGYVFVCVRERE